jgi:hypothetical protein
MGEFAEASFGKLLAKKGEVRPANKQEQINHIDFILTTPEGKEIKYDVKARKKVNRADDQATDDLIWIEFLNVLGNRGWIYGESDFIVFEREKDFLLVSRPKLVEFAEKKCDLAQMVTSANNALYRGYRRWQRHDLLSMVKSEDIAGIASEIWSKPIPAKT